MTLEEFPWQDYARADREGESEGVIERVVYSRGHRCTHRGRGARQGIHLFIRESNGGKKLALFVVYRSDSVPHDIAKTLSPGSLIRFTIERWKNGFMPVQRLTTV